MGGSLTTERGRDLHVIVVGLFGAGKTTVVDWLCPNGVTTMADNWETAIYKTRNSKVHFTVFDFVGQYNIKPLWLQYMQNTPAGLIFVVDSNDTEALSDANFELHNLLKQQRLVACASVLVLANKQDLPGAVEGSVIAERLGLSTRADTMTGRKWTVMQSSATFGLGIQEAVDWLCHNLDA
ncbi:ADP-ribosylation factor 1 [Pelomyxa schiedti]|nr:ADP-ribosylation factor 1 [Pelomyxa schiedti]